MLRAIGSGCLFTRRVSDGVEVQEGSGGAGGREKRVAEVFPRTKVAATNTVMCVLSMSMVSHTPLRGMEGLQVHETARGDLHVIYM